MQRTEYHGALKNERCTDTCYMWMDVKIHYLKEARRVNVYMVSFK